MTTTQDTGSRSPWISIWLSPRQTIDHILATGPRRFVWLLAALGMIGGLYSQVLGAGFLGGMAGWRVWLCFIAGGAVIGILFLYLNALILRGVGSLIGGRASMLELRAVLAWSAVPAILGLVIALLLNAGVRLFGAASATSPVGFSLLSLIIAGLAGFWSFVAVLLMLSRVERYGFWRTIATYAVVLIFPLLVALAIRTFLFHPYSLPSGSMSPTLLVGDNIFVSKYAYGYSHYSLPYLPQLSGRILGSEPARGDVVAFRSPKDGMTDYVKRVVGLPGDRIQMKQGRLYINDVAVKREPLEDFVGDACGTGASARVRRWRETLPNGAAYETLDCVERGFYDDTNVYTVPSGHFFMLGDNRDNSTDSRVLSAIGYIPFENLIGRVGMIYLSQAPGRNGAAAIVRAERVGLVVR